MSASVRFVVPTGYFGSSPGQFIYCRLLQSEVHFKHST